jgi:predicted aminopeptidase
MNEAFASVVEDEGIRRWLLQQGRAGEIAGHEAALSRQKDFAALLRDTRGRLAQLYGADVPPDAMRIEKQREFGRLEFRYEQLRARWGGYAGYDGWFARTLNNAHLAAVATYEDCVPGLQHTLQAAGSLPAFYATVESTRRLDVKTRHAQLCDAPLGTAR